METDRAALAAYFNQLSDDELLSRFGSGNLTEDASAIAADEIRHRNLQRPVIRASEPDVPETFEYAGDYEIVARFFDAMDAYIVHSCLEAAGVPAVIVDAHTVQTNSLLAPALGGARILVRSDDVTEAKEVIDAFQNGEFALPDEDEQS